MLDCQCSAFKMCNGYVYGIDHGGAKFVWLFNSGAWVNVNDVVYGVSLFDGLVFAATLLLLCFYFL